MYDGLTSEHEVDSFDEFLEHSDPPHVVGSLNGLKKEWALNDEAAREKKSDLVVKVLDNGLLFEYNGKRMVFENDVSQPSANKYTRIGRIVFEMTGLE